jgi:hypothetical protein
MAEDQTPMEEGEPALSGCGYRLRILDRDRILALTLCLCTGCAVNQHGLTNARLYENDTAYVLKLDAWGGHLITNSADAGLTIGHSKRLYVYPKPRRDGAPHAEAPVFPRTPDTHLRKVPATEVRARLDTLSCPVALVTEDIGLVLQLNRLRTGFLLGDRSTSALLLPREFDGVFLFRYDSENSNETRVFYLNGDYP